MKPNTFLLILTCFYNVDFTLSDNILGDWEDPNDIFGTTKSPCDTGLNSCTDDLSHCREELSALREENRCKGPRLVKQPSISDHYLKRFINILLASANFKHRTLGDGNEIRVNLNLYFNSKTLPVLQAFASDDTNGHTWTELDSSFITMFDGDRSFRVNHANDYSTIDGAQSGSSQSLENYHMTILIGAVSSIAFCMIWVYMTGSFKSAFFVGAVLIVSFCFGWTWWSEVENQRMQFMVVMSKTEGDQLPDFCKNPSHGWFGWILKSSREAECLKYLKARNVHPFATVDLAHVFSKTLQTLVFSWIPALAKSASDAIDLFYGTSWFGSFIGFAARITTGPIVVIMTILLFAVIMITNSSFRLKSFFGQIEYGTHLRSSPPALPQAQEEICDYEEFIEAREQPESQASSSPLSIEPKKTKKLLLNKFRRPKLHRSESVSLPLTFHLPISLRSPKQKSHRQLLPHETQVSKRQSEEKRFRDLRRTYSLVEQSIET